MTRPPASAGLMRWSGFLGAGGNGLHTLRDCGRTRNWQPALNAVLIDAAPGFWRQVALVTAPAKP